MARKQRTGVVVSDKMDKTVVVRIERTVRHPLYKKVIRRRKRLKAHDEANTCQLGDRVLVEECRPLSRDKSWRVISILERHEVAELQPQEIAAPPLDEDEPAMPAAVTAATAEAAPAASAEASSEAASPDAAADEESGEQEGTASEPDADATEASEDEDSDASEDGA